jgi:hypothetical protein
MGVKGIHPFEGVIQRAAGAAQSVEKPGDIPVDGG